MVNLELSEQELIRRNSLDEMRKLGIEPYPAAEYVKRPVQQHINAPVGIHIRKQ